MGDAEYFASREHAELMLANEAPSAKVRQIHLALAKRYAALAARVPESAENANDFAAQAQDAR